MKIPETLSTKSVITWFLVFIVLIGWAVWVSLLDEHESEWNREWHNSRKEMRGDSYQDSDFWRDSDKQDSPEESDAMPEQSGVQKNTDSVGTSNTGTISTPFTTLTGVTSSGINQAPQR